MFDRHLHYHFPSPNLTPPSSDFARIEYAKLWMEQSKLMWSRLQFIHLLHVAVLGSWFYLWDHEFPKILQILILSIGVYVSLFLDYILKRDGAYMDKLRDLSLKAVPELTTLTNRPNGRKCATCIIGFLCLLEISMIIAIFVSWTVPNVMMYYPHD